MSKTFFITGGAASGKTRWAITYFELFDNVLYLCIDDEIDKDILARIEFDNKRHGIKWEIETKVINPAERVTGHKFVILDSLGAYVSRVMNKNCSDFSNMSEELMHSIERQVVDEISDLIHAVQEIDGNLIIISIETGFSVCPQDKSQQCFREILGFVNQRIANMSTEVYMSASGVQFKIKG